jgi:hypothetical protein
VASNPGGHVGDNVGTIQGHMFSRHDHNKGDFNRLLKWDCTTTGIQDDRACGEPNIKQALLMLPAGGNETRPMNATVSWIVKY